MSGEMIVPIVATPRRHLLNLEDEDGGLGAVEIVVNERRIEVYVYTDEDDICTAFQVKAS